MSSVLERLPTLDDLPDAAVRGRSVFVRVDFNVPLDGGAILDDTRLKRALPTIEELRNRGARLILASHLGRPKGEHKPELSLQPVAEALGGLLSTEVAFAPDCVGDAAESTVGHLTDGGVCLLENLRFHAGEKANDPEFAAGLAQLADTYVDDAFGTAHRAHASTAGLPALVAYRAAGRLLVREVECLRRLTNEPARPYVAILGGSKVSGKIEVLTRLVETVDALLLGGGIANTFLAAAGHDVQASLIEPEHLDTARQITVTAKERRVTLGLPLDALAARQLAAATEPRTVSTAEVPEGHSIFDVGPQTIARYAAIVAEAATVFWNGPLGVFETPPFDRGTMAIARAVADCRGFTVAGGGETVAAVNRANCAELIDHVSTGGGASLELVAGRELPGVSVLERPS